MRALFQLLLFAALALPNNAMAQFTDKWEPAAETVVLYNPKFPGSEALARHYAAKRMIAQDLVIGLDFPGTDPTSRIGFKHQRRHPLLYTLAARQVWTPPPDHK